MKPEFFALYRLPLTTTLADLASFLSGLGLDFAPKWSGAAYHYDGVEQIVEHRSLPSWCSYAELEQRLASGDSGYQTALMSRELDTAPFNFGFIELQGVLHGILELSHEGLAAFHDVRSQVGGGSEDLLFGIHRTLRSSAMTLGWETAVDTLSALLAGTISQDRLEELLNGSEIRALIGGPPELFALMQDTQLYSPVTYAELHALVSWFPDFPR